MADTPRPLPVVRAMIDALDRDLLQIMAKRMALVAEVAAYKRLHGLKIRDAIRERELLRDRHEHATELGLPSEEIESIFRLLMRSSRDHQAALRAEVPMDAASYTIAIIGGHGRIGRVMARLFGDLGHRLRQPELERLYVKVTALADRTKTVDDNQLAAIIRDEMAASLAVNTVVGSRRGDAACH